MPTTAPDVPSSQKRAEDDMLYGDGYEEALNEELDEDEADREPQVDEAEDEPAESLLNEEQRAHIEAMFAGIERANEEGTPSWRIKDRRPGKNAFRQRKTYFHGPWFPYKNAAEALSHWLQIRFNPSAALWKGSLAISPSHIVLCPA